MDQIGIPSNHPDWNQLYARVLVLDDLDRLGVEPKSEDISIIQRFRKLSLMYHPDKNLNFQEVADKVFALISESKTNLLGRPIAERVHRQAQLNDVSWKVNYFVQEWPAHLVYSRNTDAAVTALATKLARIRMGVKQLGNDDLLSLNLVGYDINVQSRLQNFLLFTTYAGFVKSIKRTPKWSDPSYTEHDLARDYSNAIELIATTFEQIEADNARAEETGQIARRIKQEDRDLWFFLAIYCVVFLIFLRQRAAKQVKPRA